MSEQQTSPTVRPGQVYAGVVIRLPEPTGQELQDWRASFEDSPAAGVSPHITLMISESRGEWDRLVEHVRRVLAEWEPFHLEIHGTGTFRPVTPVVYLDVERGREQCLALHRALRGSGMDSASPSSTTRTSPWPTGSTTRPWTGRRRCCAPTAPASSWTACTCTRATSTACGTCGRPSASASGVRTSVARTDPPPVVPALVDRAGLTAEHRRLRAVRRDLASHGAPAGRRLGAFFAALQL